MALELPNPAEEAVQSAVQAPPNQELTLDTISKSQYLSEQGAMAGDKWENGQLVRVFSTPEDAQDFGHVITEQDIINHPEASYQGIKVGDRIVDGKLVPSEANEAWNKFKLDYDKSTGIVSNAFDILNSYFPLDSDVEKYGEEFATAADQRRRELIDLYNQREIQENFDPYTLHQLETNGTGGYGVVGSIVGALADPTTLLPMGATVKGAAAIGTALGLGHSMLDDVAKGKEIDKTKAAFSAAGGGLIGAGGKKLGDVVIQKLADRKAAKAAEDLIEEVAPTSAKAQVKTKTANTQEAIEKAEEAQKAIDVAITEDSATARVSSGFINEILGVMSTRLKMVSEPLFDRVRKYEFNLHRNTQDRLIAVKEWTKQLSNLNKSSQRQIGLHLSNGEFKEAIGLMPKAMRQEFTKVQQVLKDVDSQLKKAGHEYDSIENYFPRHIEDYDGFLKAQGKERQSYFEKALQNYADRKHGGNVKKLSENERSKVLNLAMRGYDSSGKINHAQMKKRTIETLSPDQYQFYSDPAKVLGNYIRRSTDDIETRNFFQASAKTDELGLDIDESIGKVLSDEINNLPKNAQEEVRELLGARFKGGRQSVGAIGNILRNTGYAGTIANPMSALTQLGDLATSGALYGLKNTLYSIFGKRYTKLVDVGLENMISPELNNARLTGKALDWAFTLSGFRAMDRIGKETTMNAALRKYMSLVNTPKGEAAFRKQWGKTFGDEIDSLVSNLKNKTVDENVKYLGFTSLLDIQPAVLSEMPVPYLKMKDGRLLYMLKSFMIKQYDIARRNILHEFKYGSKMKAIKTMALLGGYLTAANTGVYVARDMLQGRKVKPEDLPSRSLWALGGVYGLDKYTGQRYFSNGKFIEGAINLITPATPLIDAALSIGTDAYKHLSELKGKPDWAVEAPNYAKYLKPVPVFGNLVYQWFFGGAEAWNENMQKERKKRNKPDWAD